MPVRKEWVVDEEGYHAKSVWKSSPSSTSPVSNDDSCVNNTSPQKDNSPYAKIVINEVELLPGPGGFEFNKKCKVRAKVDVKDENIKKKIKFNLFCKYKGKDYEIKPYEEGNITGDVAEKEMTLFYGDKKDGCTFYEDYSKDPELTCEYVVKASHTATENIEESKPLEMPQKNILTFPDTNFKHQKTEKTYQECVGTLPNQLRSDFKKNIENLIKQMHDLGFAFGVIESLKAGYRSFQTQNDIDPTKTKAGPGESFHNYGLAVDLGVLNWVDEEGKSYNDFWLGKMDNIAKYKGFSSKIWKKRNSFCGNNVYSLSFETIHLQGVPADKSGRTALVNCLNKAVSNLNDATWRYKKAANEQYESTLGTNDTWTNIGAAKQMWSGNAKNCNDEQKKKIINHMKEAESVALTIAV